MKLLTFGKRMWLLKQARIQHAKEQLRNWMALPPKQRPINLDPEGVLKQEVSSTADVPMMEVSETTLDKSNSTQVQQAVERLRAQARLF